MGNPNNRGQPKSTPMAVKLEQEKKAQEEQLAAKKAEEYEQWAEEKRQAWEEEKLKRQQAQAEKLMDNKLKEENAKKIADTIDFDCIQKHYAITLKQEGEMKQLVITLNFCADPPTDMHAVLAILPEYATSITNVQVKILAPSQHGSRAIYKHRVERMKQLVDRLNKFPLTKLNFKVDTDAHDSFQQLKLAAAVNGLVFQDWTLAYEVWDEGNYKIETYSPYGKRLRGVYRAEFGTHMANLVVFACSQRNKLVKIYFSMNFQLSSLTSSAELFMKLCSRSKKYSPEPNPLELSFISFSREKERGGERQLAEQEKIAANQAITKRALEFDFSVLPQHPNLIIKKTKDNVEMVIDFNFFQSTSAPSMASLLATIPKYAEIITNLKVTILIKCPRHHQNLALYNARARSITELVGIMKNFRVIQLEVIAFINSHNHFGQLKLAAGAYGLKFPKWTLAYKVPGIDTKWQIQIGSPYERRLYGVYKTEFLSQQ
ncbi:hypothetical protein SBOR_2655 [Sclerotinia borealis F-4128]|uniref:Uncharacterized protein n=1 Tax=Sclerotinia borealis (strain F-4128) TaxID=1432307 RepID=W9CLS5_SCLBF|nr:hypothetical protein SBOR_2655 [Sclerotinia borealis F-4128]